MKRQGRTVKKLAQNWGGSWFLLKGYMFCKYSKWKKLKVYFPHVAPRPTGTRRLMMLTPSYLTTNQSEERPRADHAIFEPLL